MFFKSICELVRSAVSYSAITKHTKEYLWRKTSGVFMFEFKIAVN